jgi:hypothetical protein
MATTGFEWITIEGFKSILSIQELPLRGINILVGANGSGKSNFLEAFVFLGAAEAGQNDSYVKYHGGAERLLHHGSILCFAAQLAWKSNGRGRARCFQKGRACRGGTSCRPCTNRWKPLQPTQIHPVRRDA